MAALIERPRTWLGSGFRFLNREVSNVAFGCCEAAGNTPGNTPGRTTDGSTGFNATANGVGKPVAKPCEGRDADFPAIEWRLPNVPKLWLYNLHYFDYLQQPRLKAPEGLALMRDWIAQNPPYAGDGWEPYPISLRIVNWLKFLSRHAVEVADEQLIAASLYEQARRLRRTLEYHLLANHLFKNGVALLYAGALLEGVPESDGWYRKGKSIVEQEIAEQILADGGHVERSPMYHAIVLEDVLDCLNLVLAISDGDAQSRCLLQETAHRMLRFLTDVAHADGSLPRFNDTAEGIAPSLAQLRAYAGRLRVGLPEAETRSVIEEPDFGLYVITRGGWRCLVDAGPIGPDYQPGHAHCDTLSYELTFDGKFIAVNAGTFAYVGEARTLYRSTRSHNTLELDGAEQHEIWSSFRVARRGYPREVRVWEDGDGIRFAGEHTGYRRLPGRPVHRRELRLTASGLAVVDRVVSGRDHVARSYLHLHPGVRLEEWDSRSAVLSLDGRLFRVEVEWGVLSVEDYAFSREFGLQEPAKVLVVSNCGGDSGGSSDGGEGVQQGGIGGQSGLDSHPGPPPARGREGDSCYTSNPHWDWIEARHCTGAESGLEPNNTPSPVKKRGRDACGQREAVRLAYHLRIL